MEKDPPPIPKEQRKKTFCRFYLRGLCIFNSHECPFAHGVMDLNFDYYKEGEPIEYDYHKNKDDVQKNYIKGPRIYKNLYEFQGGAQGQKAFSLAELNQNRELRHLVRNEMHQQLYEQFMQLLESMYPDGVFTEPFLLRQFTRAGFNKIMMVPMKFNHIQSYLCEVPNSRYFKTTKVVPPNQQKQNVIMKRATKEDIEQAYQQQIVKIASQSEAPMIESEMKKKLFTAELPPGVPPLNQILKENKMSLIQFVKGYMGDAAKYIKPEPTGEEILELTEVYLKDHADELVSWNDVYLSLTKTLQNNNSKVIDQVKPHLVLKNHAFLSFPMVQFLYHPVRTALFKQLRQQPCQCKYQQPFPKEQLLMENMDFNYELQEGESFDIDNFETLMKCAPHILSSKVLGVDLEGNLRRGGFVEMVQLNNGKNTFLFDIWHMNQLADFQTFWLSRKILRNVMVDPNIVKIFHDCRHDSIGLHEMIETCIVNVFDTSASQTLIDQLARYTKVWKEKGKEQMNECNQAIAYCRNVKTPGLNDIFGKYQARHGINKNKSKYHKMWSKGDISLFCKRPLDPDYRDYCIRDVLDLPEMHQKMLKSLPEEAVDMAYWVSGLYAKHGYNELEKLEK